MVASKRGTSDNWRRLQRMSASESLQIGLALWTSDLARLAELPVTARPPSLAHALGLDTRGARIVR